MESITSSYENTNSTFSISAASLGVTLFDLVRTQDGEPVLTAVSEKDYHECSTQNTLALCVINNLMSYTRLNVEVLCLLECSFTIEAYHDEYYRMELPEEILV